MPDSWSTYNVVVHNSLVGAYRPGRGTVYGIVPARCGPTFNESVLVAFGSADPEGQQRYLIPLDHESTLEIPRPAGVDGPYVTELPGPPGPPPADVTQLGHILPGGVEITDEFRGRYRDVFHVFIGHYARAGGIGVFSQYVRDCEDLNYYVIGGTVLYALAEGTLSHLLTVWPDDVRFPSREEEVSRYEDRPYSPTLEGVWHHLIRTYTREAVWGALSCEDVSTLTQGGVLPYAKRAEGTGVTAISAPPEPPPDGTSHVATWLLGLQILSGVFCGDVEVSAAVAARWSRSLACATVIPRSIRKVALDFVALWLALEAAPNPERILVPARAPR